MSAVPLKRWTREEYDRLIEAGVLSPEERVELLEGDLVRMWPQNPAHAIAISNVEEALREVFRTGFYVRVQMPIVGGDDSEPEPDVAVVRGHRRNYVRAHPATAVLVVEVSDSTLDYDRRRKGSAYARTDVLDYWIVNLVNRLVEVYRDPTDDRGYQTMERFRPGETITPLGAPLASIAVDDLLP
jgi:Uma2 family endonuclease